MSLLGKVTVEDVKSIIFGLVGWSLAIGPVMVAGNAVTATNGDQGKLANKIMAVVFGVGLAAVTTPLASYILGWKTPTQKVRGIALALGAAQTVDGLVHIFYPTFYSKDPTVGLGCAGNIFFGAGLLGIFSAYA